MLFPCFMSTRTKYHRLLFLICHVIGFSAALKPPGRYESRRMPPAGADMAVASSVAVSNYKLQSVASPPAAADDNRRYGYPFLIAPTLPPFISARSDDDENEAARGSLPTAKSHDSGEEDGFKKGAQKKHKAPYYGAIRRQGYDDDDEDVPAEKIFRSYREPKYRNFDELETSFRPRRIDVGIPYDYDYRKSSRRPELSPRDPYLSPNGGHSDSFYPSMPKVVAYAQRDRGVPSYGAGKYDEQHDYHSEHIHGGYRGGYAGPASKYPPSSDPYSYHEDYAIESNKPIIGDIRKRLLDYAGASDLYEGEPDYLREVARNKYKYGNLGNDYYVYGGSGYRSSYRDFPYVESKVSRIVKKSRV